MKSLILFRIRLFQHPYTIRFWAFLHNYIESYIEDKYIHCSVHIMFFSYVLSALYQKRNLSSRSLQLTAMI